MQKTFLQSEDWLNFQKKLNKDSLKIENENFSVIFFKYQLPLGFYYLYAPKGPVFKNSSDGKKITDSILEIINQVKIGNKECLFLRMDPELQFSEDLMSSFRKAGLKKTKSAQPEETIVLNLEKSEDDILRQMEYETRYSIKSSIKKGVQIIRAESVEEKQKYFNIFWEIYEDTNKRHNLKTYEKKYFENLINLNGELKSYLYLAKVEDKIVSVAIFLAYNRETYYLFAGSITGFGRFNTPTRIIWEAINEFKRLSYKSLDLWGVSEANPKWRGITKFKKSFGGKLIKYIGTYEYPLINKFYLLYKIIKIILNK